VLSFWAPMNPCFYADTQTSSVDYNVYYRGDQLTYINNV
jgi:hypothetical protein